MKHKIAVVGLGYVGLPLARLFATKYPVVGFDINEVRVNDLNRGVDDTLEVTEELLKNVLKHNSLLGEELGLLCTSNLEDIKDSNIY